jgi:hypothetical protein
VLAVVLLVAGLAMAATLLGIWRLNRQPAPVSAEFERLVQSIADLDERFEKGQLPQTEYESERARLKGELVKLME